MLHTKKVVQRISLFKKQVPSLGGFSTPFLRGGETSHQQEILPTPKPFGMLGYNAQWGMLQINEGARNKNRKHVYINIYTHSIYIVALGVSNKIAIC